MDMKFFLKIWPALKRVNRFFWAALVTPLVLAVTFSVRKTREKKFLVGPEPSVVLVTYFGRGLGDCIYFSGVLKSLRERFPKAKIELAILQQFEIYFRGNPYVDEILACPDYYKDFKGFFRFLGSSLARRQKGRVDLFIDLLPNMMIMPPVWSCGISKQYSIGIVDFIKTWFYDKPVPINWKVHFYDSIAEGLRPLGILEAKPEFWVPQGAPAPAFLREQIKSESAIIIAPGGRRTVEAPKDYCWSFTGFKKIVERLTAQGFPVIMTGAPYDLELASGIKEHPLLTNLIGKTSLLQIFSIVKIYGRLVVCNNSGLLHIANILGVPSVSYADLQENMVRWPAYDNSGKHIFLQDQPEKNVTAEKLLEAILKKLNEPACHFDGRSEEKSRF